MSTVERSDSVSAAGGGLHRELKVADAAAFSIGLVGPVGGMALLGAGAAGLLGTGATWAFLFAIIGVGLVAYGFIKLSGFISHTGSVYALVRKTLGPHAGFIAGFALFGAYMTIGTGSTIEIGLFLDPFLHGIHLISPATEWIWTALIAVAVVIALSFTEIRLITRALLISELIGAALVALLSVVILVRTGTGHAPGGHTLSWHFLSLPSGTGVSTIAGAAVFGFLAFAGFEGAAALGEETADPKREIPRAIRIAVVIVGAFFLLTIIAQSVGYGTDAAGVKAFVGGSTYGDLGGSYIGTAYGVTLDFRRQRQPVRDHTGHHQRRRAGRLRPRPRRGRPPTAGEAVQARRAPANAYRRQRRSGRVHDCPTPGRHRRRQRHLLLAHPGQHRPARCLRPRHSGRAAVPVPRRRAQSSAVADHHSDRRTGVRALHDLQERHRRARALPVLPAVGRAVAHPRRRPRSRRARTHRTRSPTPHHPTRLNLQGGPPLTQNSGRHRIHPAVADRGEGLRRRVELLNPGDAQRQRVWPNPPVGR